MMLDTIEYAINNYTTRLLRVYVKHQNNQMINILEDEVKLFKDYLPKEFPGISEQFIKDHMSEINLFQQEYNQLKSSLLNIKRPLSKDDLFNLNTKIINFANERKQKDRWTRLDRNKKDAV